MEHAFRPHLGGRVLAVGLVGLAAGVFPAPHVPQDPAKQESQGVVTVRLKTTDGKVPSEALVALRSKQHFRSFPKFATGGTADESGLVRIKDVPPGEYSLVARWMPNHEDPDPETRMQPSPGNLPATVQVWWSFREGVVPGTADQELVLTEGIKQAIVVRGPSKPTAIEVSARLALRKGDSYSAFPKGFADRIVSLNRYDTCSDGRLDINGLVPGQWACVITIPGYGRTGEVPFTVPSEKPIEITVPAFISVSGVVSAPPGVSVAKVNVEIRYDDHFLLIVEDGQTTDESDEQGNFVIRNVRPGRIKIGAAAEFEKYRFEQEMKLEPGKDLENVAIVLTQRK